MDSLLYHCEVIIVLHSDKYVNFPTTILKSTQITIHAE